VRRQQQDHTAGTGLSEWTVLQPVLICTQNSRSSRPQHIYRRLHKTPRPGDEEWWWPDSQRWDRMERLMAARPEGVQKCILEIYRC